MLSKSRVRSIRRCYHKNGAPRRCPNCLSPDLVEEVRDSLDVGVGAGIPMEVETLCNKCKSSVAYWAHGYYDPCYLMDKLGVEY